ncbi:DNA-processing protein DprA [Candidatus Cytomitobacter indipagum]|nr:DNA-processing protein DprA [Candidatus Cytomitobacter indipagum]
MIKYEQNNNKFNKILTEEEKIDFLRVIRTKNIGPISFFHLLNTHKTIDKVIKFLETKLEVKSKTYAVEEMRKIRNYGADIICFSEPNYPILLREIRDCPPVICAKGDLGILSREKLFAIAGSRTCSVQSQVMTKRITSELGENGYTIVSGLARGIDTCAHQNSLNTGTIAVLANGIDHVYPSENKSLYEKIAIKGVILSEVEFGTKPSAHLFPNRNRIIAGMSLGVLIAEASVKSGSLITSQCALENGRDVFAIPGCPLDPRSRGANKLIKQGAALVEFIHDITNAFEDFSLKEPVESYIPEIKYDFSEKQLSDYSEKLLDMIGFFPISIELLINKMDIPISTVRALLAQLEIEGKISHSWGNKVSLRR